MRYSSQFSSLCASAALLLAGCATSLTPAPVTDRSPSRSNGPVALPPIGTAPTGVATAPSGNAPAYSGPNADKAGQPGYYVVKPGDTVMRVALESGQYWRDVVRWNSMDNPNVLEVGQVLRVAAPAGEALTKPVLPPTRVDGKPLGAASAPVAGASSPSQPAVATLPAVPTPAPVPVPVSPPSPVGAAGSDVADEDIAWSWPAAGGVLAPFDEARRGIDIAGKVGDPVFAAADGRVLYADSGLRGYGNLVILRHNNTYLTAYAYNSKLLVKEGDAVKRNQRIAEMGSSSTDRVKLHFEIRRLGKAVDPSKLLPSK